MPWVTTDNQELAKHNPNILDRKIWELRGEGYLGVIYETGKPWKGKLYHWYARVGNLVSPIFGTATFPNAQVLAEAWIHKHL